MSKKNIVPICSAADREKAGRLLALLRERGLARPGGPGEEKTPQKGDIVLLLLSQSFAADEEAQARFFAADTAGASVIPVDLDGSAQPELVRTAVIAKNAIGAQGRSDGEIAERIASAPDFQDPPPPPWLPRVLIALGVLLVLGAAAWLWLGRGTGSAGKDTAVPALAPGELAAAQRLGLTAEDLARITSFCIVGDANGVTRTRFTTDSSINPGKRVYLDDLAYDSDEEDGRHWYSTEDGHEYTLTRYDDLSVIELMPNLQQLTLVLVETDKLPSLAGLDKLEQLRLENCRLGDLDWVRDGSFLQFTCRECGVEDFSPLGSCERLREAEIELGEVRRADFSGVRAPSLHNISLRGGPSVREADLSGLAECPLWELRLFALPLKDLDFLRAEQSSLSQLELDGLREVRSVEPIGRLSGLTWLWIRDLQGVRDLTPLGRCGNLKEFEMQSMRQIRDLDFLKKARTLRRVSLGNAEIEDLDFLETMANNIGTELEISGTVGDWSALSLSSFYSTLRIWPDNRRVGDILPYLEGCSVGDLRIGNASDLDLAMLPKVSSRLELQNCPNVTDLGALSDAHSFHQLELQDMPRLRSLDGLQKIGSFGRKGDGFGCELWIEGCPRLEDWSAVNGCRFSRIQLRNVFTLPDFSKLSFYQRSVLRLENIPGLTDMSFLDGAPPEGVYFSFELVGLDDLRDLSALRRFRGEYIAVPPELLDKAQALVEAKCFERCDVAYPSGGWDNDYGDFTLLSLDELDTLSDNALSRVTRLCLAGDQLVDRDRYDVWDEWDGRRQHLYLVDRDSDERTEVKTGGFADLSALSKLTGLRCLELYALPVTSLDGIQIMSELEELRVRNCPKLTDASAAFTLQGLRELEIARSPITSIQGVQNLTQLQGLGIYETDVKDLSPLRELDYAASEREGGFGLSVGGMSCDDYSPIEAIPVIGFLDLNGAPVSRWPDLTRIRELRSLSAHGDDLTQEDLETILAAHPELEELQIPYNEKIDDLTPLLGMEKLQRVIVDREMKKAVAGLEGRDLPFELEIW